MIFNTRQLSTESSVSTDEHSSFSQNIGGIAKNTTPAVDANTNRFTSTDFGYDANGNVIADIDQISNLPRQFIFNGDNKQTEVKCDGERRRSIEWSGPF